MRTVIQLVKHASVTVDDAVTGKIERGLLVLVGIEDADKQDDIEWLAKKIVNLRIFTDNDGLMNLSLKDVGGELLVVSQFTLFAQSKKGNRPSYIRASKPEIAIPIYQKFCDELTFQSGRVVQTGVFGADMKVELLNDGPVTIWIDTKNRE